MRTKFIIILFIFTIVNNIFAVNKISTASQAKIPKAIRPIDILSLNNDGYYGPINLKLVFYDVYSSKLLDNAYVFLNNNVASPTGGNLGNYYLKTDKDGAVRLTLSNNSLYGYFRAYKVGRYNSQIDMDCKLTRVNNAYSTQFEVPEANSENDIVFYLGLQGGSCMRDSTVNKDETIFKGDEWMHILTQDN